MVKIRNTTDRESSRPRPKKVPDIDMRLPPGRKRKKQDKLSVKYPEQRNVASVDTLTHSDKTRLQRRYLQLLIQGDPEYMAARKINIWGSTISIWRGLNATFDMACRAAQSKSIEHAERELYRRAVDGVTEDIYSTRSGAKISERIKHSDQLLLAWLRRYSPEWKAALSATIHATEDIDPPKLVMKLFDSSNELVADEHQELDSEGRTIAKAKEAAVEMLNSGPTDAEIFNGNYDPIGEAARQRALEPKLPTPAELGFDPNATEEISPRSHDPNYSPEDTE